MTCGSLHVGIGCEGVTSGEVEKGPAGLARMDGDLEVQNKVLVTRVQIVTLCRAQQNCL